MNEEINPTAVGLRIREIRKQLGLSMSAFAERIDEKAKSGTVSNWETGKNLPNNARLKRIAELGNTTVEELLYEEAVSVREYITTILENDDSFPLDNPINKKALEDTISCFEDCGLPLEEMDISTVLLSNVSYHEGNNGFRIHDRESYMDFLNKRIQAFEPLLKRDDIEDTYAMVIRISIQVDKETLRDLQG